MNEDGEVRPEGCICEPCSDIPELDMANRKDGVKINEMV